MFILIYFHFPFQHYKKNAWYLLAFRSAWKPLQHFQYFKLMWTIRSFSLLDFCHTLEKYEITCISHDSLLRCYYNKQYDFLFSWSIADVLIINAESIYQALGMLNFVYYFRSIFLDGIWHLLVWLEKLKPYGHSGQNIELIKLYYQITKGNFYWIAILGFPVIMPVYPRAQSLNIRCI